MFACLEVPDEKVLGLGQRSPPPPPYSHQNGCTPLGFTHWLAAAPVDRSPTAFVGYPTAVRVMAVTVLRALDGGRMVVRGGATAVAGCNGRRFVWLPAVAGRLRAAVWH